MNSNLNFEVGLHMNAKLGDSALVSWSKSLLSDTKVMVSRRFPMPSSIDIPMASSTFVSKGASSSSTTTPFIECDAPL